MFEQVRNVLEDKVRWLLLFQNCSNVEEQVSLLGALKAELLTCLGKGLTRKPCSQHIVAWHVTGVDFGYVASRFETYGVNLADYDQLLGREVHP